MKKIFTLISAMMALAGFANAATEADIAVCKHSYVLVCDEATNDGTVRPGMGNLFGNGFFLDVKSGGTVATNKGKSDPAEMIPAVTDPETGEEITPATYRYGEEFAKKYGEYGAHYNSLRLKNAQDVIAMRVTAGSKLIFLLQGNNKTGKDARYPKIAKDAALNEALNDAPTADFTETTSAGFKYEWTAKDDGLIYIGSYNGDMFLGFLIVEANEAPGTPSIKVGDQTFENGLWFREVTCKTNTYEMYGVALPTVCTYTVDGSEPTATSTVYKEPIKCYSDQVVKFQAFVDIMGDGTPADVCPNADNEGIVNFSFDAPSIQADGANVTITSKYEGAKNYVTYLDKEEVETSAFTLTESATVTALTKIQNGSYCTFTTKSTTKDVYVLNPLKAETTIAVTAGEAVLDEAATATSTTGNVYTVENGAISADKMNFFVKNLEFGVVKDANAKYQIDNKEVYIKMNNTNITFLVDEKDSVDVVVTCSKNSCKTFDIPDPTGKDTANVHVAVNVDGKVFGDWDITAGNPDNLDGYRNVITFSLGAGIHTFQKFSGTGNILISSIKFTPRLDCFVGIKNLDSEKKVAVKKAMVNGRLVIKTANGTFNAAGVRVE